MLELPEGVVDAGNLHVMRRLPWYRRRQLLEAFAPFLEDGDERDPDECAVLSRLLRRAIRFRYAESGRRVEDDPRVAVDPMLTLLMVKVASAVIHLFMTSTTISWHVRHDRSELGSAARTWIADPGTPPIWVPSHDLTRASGASGWSWILDADLWEDGGGWGDDGGGDGGD
ncbi:hypothetical protein [Microbacterium sp. BK668]|uniref:hypothetical protein n=1 Tax=Microbacterium sp. BK668 TaxID=2512118 RepID=UPI001060D775|nr:hypothetical protein [Microbacterium sp. BK668]